MVDLIIIGAGPAGLSGAVYGMRAGLTLMVMEETPMGEVRWSIPMRWIIILVCPVSMDLNWDRNSGKMRMPRERFSRAEAWSVSVTEATEKWWRPQTAPDMRRGR